MKGPGGRERSLKRRGDRHLSMSKKFWVKYTGETVPKGLRKCLPGRSPGNVDGNDSCDKGG